VLDLERLLEIKRLAIIAMFANDDLMDRWVLKGGNAIDVFYNIASRSSVDLDFSMPDEFEDSELNDVTKKIENSLKKIFLEQNYHVFDVKLQKKPKMSKTTISDPEIEKFWGGYQVEFKVIESNKFSNFENDAQSLRMHAIDIAPGSIKKFYIDISKYEYCDLKTISKTTLNDYTIYVYTPLLIVCEKLRAICQQMEEYKAIVKSSSRSPRAKDFFDIYYLMDMFSIDLTTEDNKHILEQVFLIKKVPLQFLANISSYRDYHRDSFVSLKDTIKQGVDLQPYDFYFDFVTVQINLLKSLWDK